MNEYNVAFFGLYTNLYLVLLENYGEKISLKLFKKIMEKGLKSAYDNLGFKKGDINDFIRVITERDNAVGVKIEIIQENKKIIYRFFTDPFPLLRGVVEPKKIVKTYIDFKVKYLLGDEWSYALKKHFWLGDEFTEILITKND